MIEIQSVSKSFKGNKVLDKISLNINKGEIFGLLGPSGSGKTTLIRLIIGALKADNGQVIIDDVEVPDFSILKRIGFMPQNDALYYDLTGEENLGFFAGLYPMKNDEKKRRIHDVLSLVNLENDRRKRVALYSGGMKKRLSLAAALLHKPSLLILDEPTVGIDPVLRKTIWNEFFHLKEQGITIVVTTHVMDEAGKCDRLALLYNGGIIACGEVPELLEKAGSLEELFFIGKENNA